MKNKHYKNWKSYLSLASLGLLAGSTAILTAGVQLWTPLRLPQWISSSLFWVGFGAIIAYGFNMFRRMPLLSRTWIILAVSVALFFNGIGLVYAGYLGPNRTVTTTAWERLRCSYDASYDPPGPGFYGCSLDLYYSPGGSCPSTGSVSGFFNPTACVGWPGSCSSLPCSISQSGSGTEGCSSGDTGCQETTSMTTLPPATVSGTTACSQPGNGSWCRGTAVINLSASEPVGGSSITIIEGDPGTLCGGSSCAWTFPQGVTSFNYWAHSTFGDTSEMASTSMMVDSVAPNLTLTIPPPDGANGWFVSAATASASASDSTSGVSGSASINGGDASFNASSDGVYNLTATVSDVAGNTSSASGTIRLDTAPPVPGFSQPAPDGQNGWYVSSVTVAPNGSDATSGIAGQEVSLDNATWSSSVTISTDGTYTVYERLSDVAGHTNTSTMSIRLDTTPPSVTVTIPPPSDSAGWYTTLTFFSTAESDATSGVASTEYSVDGGAWQSTAPTLSDGTHTVQVRVTDVAGNITTSTRTVNVDTVPPLSAFVSPPEGSSSVVRGTLTMSGATSDVTSGAAGAEMSLNGGATWAPLTLGPGGTWSYTWDTTTASSGAHDVLVRATDIAGNLENTAHITIIINNQPPSVSITPLWTVFGKAAVSIKSGSSPVVGASITVSDPKNRWPDVTTKYGAGNLPTSFTWTGRTGNNTTARAGKYPVTVTAWDAYGNSAEASGWVIILLAPSATPTEVPPTPTEIPTEVPTVEPTRQIAVVIIPTPALAKSAAPVVVVVEKPVEVTPPTAQIILWPAVAFVALLAVLASASLSDRRPQALRGLSRSLDATREVQKSYPPEE